MNTSHTSSPARSRRPLPWLVMLGLASLSLLWPLTALWQIEQGPPRAVAIMLVTALTWSGVVGIGRVPRPVLTLTLTGVMHGLIGLVLGLLLPGQGPAAGPGSLVLLLPSLLTSAVAGALLGVVALGVQSVLGPRPGESAGRRS